VNAASALAQWTADLEAEREAEARENELDELRATVADLDVMVEELRADLAELREQRLTEVKALDAEIVRLEKIITDADL
jgi:predicted RNase H-like nuclease (RuvC/YqgF family)